MSVDADALAAAVRRGMTLANPRLSRFDPLPRIIAYDDFDRGHCGWSQLVGNYEGSLDTILPGYRELNGPCCRASATGTAAPTARSTAPTR